LTIDKESGRLIGRGASDDKGPLLGWINNLQAHHELGLELPVNIRICLEGKTTDISARVTPHLGIDKEWRRAVPKVLMT
jgi:acetylornithine deacetylase/succinyl-diaminopimelate desuccinylase-like protein